MSEPLRITVLVENSVHRGGLAAEHGLSVLVQWRGLKVLFDTGQTGLVERNAALLGVSLETLDALVLSHGHYDHVGGVAGVLDMAPRALVYVHPAAFEPKYHCSPSGAARPIGMNAVVAMALRTHRPGIRPTCSWTMVGEGIHATGEIPRTSRLEDTGGPFFLDPKGRVPDPIPDDQALVLDGGRSVVVLLGCAHAGVVNTLEHVAAHTGNKPVRAVVGGMHLGAAGEARMRQTLDRLGREPLECLMPMHCTGWPATARLWEAFPKAFRTGDVGAVLEFDVD